jgi:hypothetical protein
MTAPWYATREEVKQELDVKETSRSNARVDRAVEDASRRVEGLLHRSFAPTVATRYFDWPAQYARPWRLWLDGNDLISITMLTTGSDTIAASDYFLRRSDNREESPYTRVEIDLDSSAAFGGSSTQQRDIAIAGLWGYRNDETPTGALAAAVSSTSATTITVDGPASAALGVGSVLRIDSERMIVTGRVQTTTGQTLQTPLTNLPNNETVVVTTGSAYAVDEVLLLDAERIRVDDIAGNNLVGKRAWDGSTIAAHAGSTIYAPRVLTVTRGALGTTAATHSLAAAVNRWDAPGPVRQLTIAEALTDLKQGQTGYARTAGSGDNEREVFGRGLADLRDSAYNECGRKARKRAV